MSTVAFKNGNPDVPVRNILCIGRNYVKHAEELGNELPKSPVVFIKPVSSLIREGMPIELPAFSEDVHYETELVLLVGKKGKNIPPEDALTYIQGAAVGLDLTARDVQTVLKDKGLPWTIAKGFDTAACVSKFVPFDIFADVTDIRFHMDLNGERRQEGNTSLMIFPIRQIVSYLSSIFTLDAGDIIFTGTPEGVGPLGKGDTLSLSIDDTVNAEFHIA